MRETGSSTGLVFTIYPIGNIAGTFACGPLADRWGRRWGMFIGATIIILGTCVQAPSTSLTMFMCGRFILGFGVSICCSAAPAYVAEIAHPAWRGTITGLYNTFWFIGSITATFTLYGTNKITSNLEWRLPIWLQMSFSGAVVLGCLFCPESPRWYVSCARYRYSEQALANRSFCTG